MKKVLILTGSIFVIISAYAQGNGNGNGYRRWTKADPM